MRMKLLTLLIALSLATIFSLPANANTQALGTCFVDSLNGKERKKLAKWIYFAIAAHPEMQTFSNISTADRVNTDKYVGALVTRLLAENCSSELKVAQETDPLALKTAFELVGRVAMQELLTDQSVTTAITNYANYVDQNKMNSVFVEK